MKKIALIGAGNIGKTHARNMVAHQHCHLTHIYDLNPQAAAQLAASVGAKAVLSPEDIWNADIDAVMVASSTATHADFLEQAIRFGKPVYLEKPIDLDIKRVKDVVQLAHENPVPVLVGFSRRFDTNHLAVQQAVQSGEIGQLEMVLMTARDPTPPPLAYIKTSGGQLRDQAIHFFDLACWIANQTPLEVYATGSALVDASIGAVGDVDTSMLILKMPSGALVHLDLSRRTGYGYDERIEAFGSLGMIESGRKPTGQVRRYKADKQISSGLDAGWFERMETTFGLALDAFVRSLKGENLSYPTLADGLRAQLVAEAAVQSLKTGVPVKVENWQPEQFVSL